MPVDQARRVRDFGTKVRLFPQAPFLAGFGDPETVWLSPPAGSVLPGPSDDRMYVIDVVDKPEPYRAPYLPPYVGARFPPVMPDAEGHFDHLDFGSRQFLSAHLYGSLRYVLDIFESFLGRRVEWPFRDQYDRLELIPLVDWDNAQSGYGFMEFGYARDEPEGHMLPYALNFDVIAHEMGHSILFSTLGLPDENAWTDDFRAFHEASADLVSLLSLMHFDTVIDRILRATRGNIYTLNELNRIGELSETQQIRIASNNRKMSQVTLEVHDMSRPLTGAIFDFLVESYLDALYSRGLIQRDLCEVCLQDEGAAPQSNWIQAQFNEAYQNRHFQFKSALLEARDIVGERLVATWSRLSPNNLTFRDVAERLLEVDLELSGNQHQSSILAAFQWREILD
jgi:hypothetical protein